MRKIKTGLMLMRYTFRPHLVYQTLENITPPDMDPLLLQTAFAKQ